MQKRILLLTFFYPPDLSAGSFRAVALMKALRAQASGDVQIDLLTTQPNRYKSFARDALDCEEHEGLSIHRVQLPEHQGGLRGQAWSFLCFAWAVCRFIRGQQYDLVYATSSRLMTALLGALVAAAKGARLYLDIRDIFVENLQAVFNSAAWRPGIWLFEVLESWTIGRADRVNLVSPGFLPYFQSRYPGARFSAFSNGVDGVFVRQFSDSRGGSARGEPLRVVYAGNIGDGQSLHSILPALAEQLVGRARFQVIGDGSRSDELRKALAQRQIENVELLKPVPRKELQSIYERADVLFLHLNDLPAFKRVLPSKLFEYAATGKPIWAGVGGYAAGFVNREIANAAVFPPCDATRAVQCFEQLSIGCVDRSVFAENYARERIMREMAQDVLELLEPA
ncbi:glycosyltransferase family 4 protein [Pseudomonas sp. CC6-YY-74]|uniref:glycosyltransferase family 4 protein n=1 Tax=Pseudomonas sp. CC6-YY-74 TaxID=1930532 RepID=UPI0009A18976|nr:glycosyltransferase family 4 protein [Pseudomonas sp. CC6-YY-74]